MLNDQEWEQFRRLLYRLRGFNADGEMLLFTSRSMVDLILSLSQPLLRMDDGAAVLENWDKRIEPFLRELHAIAREQNPTFEIRGQAFRVVSERTASRAQEWVNENCPRGLD
jgi:hypothetical protein